jgi:formylglycine-generating enzyme required for sulfatase activity
MIVCLIWRVQAAKAGDQGERFVRGDVTADYVVDVTDVVASLQYLFLSDPAELACEDAADTDDDGSINLGDSLYLLFYLFEATPKELPDPFQTCGVDSAPNEGLSCESYWPCATGPFLNFAGIRLLPVAAGRFNMGSPATEQGRYRDERQHEVVISCPFYLSETEITQGQFLSVMGYNPSHFNGNQGDGTDYGINLSRCLENVTWNEAMEFCRVLSRRDGRNYRLPYEAEWEYACRAGTETRFSFGDALDCYDEGWDHCPQPSTCGLPCPQVSHFMYWPEAPEMNLIVKTKPSNSWGFYGMHDLMAEWCMDWYGPYPNLGPVFDPIGPDTGTMKVARGWVNSSIGLKVSRCACRLNLSLPPFGTDQRWFLIGFRIVAEIPGCGYGD